MGMSECQLSGRYLPFSLHFSCPPSPSSGLGRVDPLGSRMNGHDGGLQSQTAQASVQHASCMTLARFIWASTSLPIKSESSGTYCRGLFFR